MHNCLDGYTLPSNEIFSSGLDSFTNEEKRVFELANSTELNQDLALELCRNYSKECILLTFFRVLEKRVIESEIRLKEVSTKTYEYDFVCRKDVTIRYEKSFGTKNMLFGTKGYSQYLHEDKILADPRKQLDLFFERLFSEENLEYTKLSSEFRKTT